MAPVGCALRFEKYDGPFERAPAAAGTPLVGRTGRRQWPAAALHRQRRVPPFTNTRLPVSCQTARFSSSVNSTDASIIRWTISL